MLADLNFHHLRYFWVVAREGSIAKACLKLHVAQPTISGQLRELEQTFGDKLFLRVGRGLQLTDVGRTVLDYCDEIFSLGRELSDTLAGTAGQRATPVMIGVSDAVSKLIAYRLMEPALRLPVPVRLRCVEDETLRLFAELAVHNLDLVLCDQPLSDKVSIRAYSHLLGDSPVTWYAPRPFQKLRKGFPRSLNGQPMLLPTSDSVLRRDIEDWCERHEVAPRIVGEFEDNALLMAFARAGAGVFCAPSVLAPEISSMYESEPLGELDGVRERYYAISIQRRLTHPAVVAISQAARRTFGPAPRRRS